MNDDVSLDELDGRVVSLVEQCWADREAPLLLSALGNEGGGRIGREAKGVSGSLRAYLRDRIADKIQIIEHSSKESVIGIIPKNVYNSQWSKQEIDNLLDRTSNTQDRIHSSLRYLPAIWTAFNKPLEEDKERFLSPSEPFFFLDEIPSNKPAGFKDISRDYILGFKSDQTAISNNIRKWATENNFDIERFLAKQSNDRKNLPSNDLLGHMVTTLSLDDLKRLTIPMDIVKKLREISA